MKIIRPIYRKILITVLYVLVVVIAFITSFTTKTTTPTLEDNARAYFGGNRCSFPIAAVGDLQRTSLWEYMIGRESSDVERKEIVENIVDQNPGSVILLGDMVFEGDNIDHWRYFDSLMIPLEKKFIPLFPIIGNHEYRGKNRIALQYLYKRFPVLKKHHWYAEMCDSIALIFLDSNNMEYTEEQWDKQVGWFKNKLMSYDGDPSIKGILVFAHHPPFSNSLVTGDDMEVKMGFVNAFENSKKTLAFITGHAHTYERIIEKGKTFIISGGGGGPRVLLKTGPDIHHDYYNGSSPRPFNYLLINKGNDGIIFTVRGVKKAQSGFFTMEQFKIAYIR